MKTIATRDTFSKIHTNAHRIDHKSKMLVRLLSGRAVYFLALPEQSSENTRRVVSAAVVKLNQTHYAIEGMLKAGRSLRFTHTTRNGFAVYTQPANSCACSGAVYASERECLMQAWSMDENTYKTIEFSSDPVAHKHAVVQRSGTHARRTTKIIAVYTKLPMSVRKQQI